MEEIRSRVSYLQGLAEGMDIDASSPEGRVITAVLDVLGEVTQRLDDLIEAQEELAEYLEDVDFDLGALEDAVYADEEEEADFTVDEDDAAEVCFIPEAEVRKVEDGVDFVACPICGETVAAAVGEVDDEVEGDLTCPTCGTEIVFGNADYDEDLIIERN